MTEEIDTESWLALSPIWNVLVINTEETLAQARDILGGAYVIGIDAEWEPYASKPKAALCQLAVRTRSSLEQHVLLLDFLALDQGELRALLQGIFRAPDVLKVGFSLVMDLWALAAALGGDGGSCVAVLSPVIDTGVLHRTLLARHAPGIAKAGSCARPVTGKGLSGLVHAQLGQRLDKRHQCSSWSTRPLSQEQVEYAALDAAVLLMLLDSFMAAALPVPAAPSEEADEGAQNGRIVASAAPAPAEARPSSATQESTEGGSAPQGVHLGSSEGQPSRAGMPAGAERAEKTGRNSAAACSAGARDERQVGISRSGTDGDNMPGSSGRAAEAEEEAAGRSRAAAEEAVARAAAQWGMRLEVAGGKALALQRPPKRSVGRRAMAGRAQQEDPTFGWPAVIPWQEGGGGGAGEPRFVCDVMCEGLARQLRLCGLDVRSGPILTRPQRYQAYRHMVETAEGEHRVILTADTFFLQAGYSQQAYWVRASNKREQLLEVLTAFRISVEQGDLLSRCARCNGTFVPRALSRAELPANNGLSVGGLALHNEFYVCSNAACQKIYWQGSQYGNAIQNLCDRIGGLGLEQKAWQPA